MADDGRSRDEGAFSDEYDDDDFLCAVRENEPVGTSDVAAIVGCHRSTALRRLRTLAEEGKVEPTTVGPAQVWTLVE